MTTTVSYTLGDGTWCEVDGCGEQSVGRVCGACRARFESALRAIAPEGCDAIGNPLPTLADELDAARARQDRTTAEGPVVTASPSRPLPYRDRPREVGADLWDALARWYARLAPELPDPPSCACPDTPVGPWCWAAHCWAWETGRVLADRVPEPAVLDGLAAWFLRNVETVLRNDLAPEAVGDVLARTGAALRVIDGPPRLVYAGPCDCGLELYANPAKARVVCRGRPDAPGCGTIYQLDARREWLREALREHHATAAEIAHGIGELVGEKVTLQRLGTWVNREKLEPVGRRRVPASRPPRYRPLYRVGDVLDLLSARVSARTP